MKRFRRHSAKANFEHFRVLTARYFKQIFTNVGTFLPLLLEAPVLLVILYLVADGDAFTARNVGQANIATFVLVVMATLMAILNSYREICKEREVLAREIYGGLDVTAYVLSKIVVLSAIGLVQCALLFGGSLIFIDYAFPRPATGYLLAYLAMALANIAVTALGLFISALLKKSESAILPVLLVIIMQVVFSDCIISLEGGAGNLKYITPAAWGISVFGNVCGINGWNERFYKDMYALSPAIGLIVLAVFAVVFVFLAIVRLKREFRQKD